MENLAKSPSPGRSAISVYDGDLDLQAGGPVAPLDTDTRQLHIRDTDDSSLMGCIRPSFESLPAEIRRLVLFSLASLEDMNRLVHACPIYHAQYVLDRETYLRHSLNKTIGLSTLIDAYSCHESRLRLVIQSRALKRIDQFLSDYEAWRSDPGNVVSQLNMGDLSRIASFYLTVVRPLVDYFFGTFIANFQTQQNSVMFGPSRRASPAERSRILRALYRFQFYCHAFGFIKRPVAGEDLLDIEDTRDAMIRRAYCLFEPWEVEEISCIGVLIEDKYEEVFKELQWHFDSYNPKLSKYGGSFHIFPMHLSRLGPERM